MKKLLSIIGVVAFIGFLLLVRAFENSLFYDPLLEFFKRDYQIMPLPKMDLFRLFIGIVFRYALNATFSVFILWFVFKDVEIIKVSIILYIILFVVLLLTFSWLVLSAQGTSDHFYLFYVRRFLIQPLFLLILLPAFYFQKFKSR